MALGKFPMSRRMVIELLGPLVGARGKFQYHHVLALEDLMYHLWIFNKNLRESVIRVRAALRLLERCFDLHPHEFVQIVYDTVLKLGPIQMEGFTLSKRAWESRDARDPDPRFRPLLDLYSFLYERFYPLAAAPPVAADSFLRTRVNVQTLIADDGRVHPNVVE